MKNIPITILIVLTVLFSCSNEAQMENAALRIDIESTNGAKTILPQGSLNIASYRIDGKGPSDSTFSLESSSGSCEIANLTPGRWTVTAFGLDNTKETIAKGSTDIFLKKGSNSASIAIEPLKGNGELSLSYTFSPQQADETAVIEVTLKKGEQVIKTEKPALNISEGTAAIDWKDIPSGTYMLESKLVCHDTIFASAVDAVRIMEGRISSADIGFIAGDAENSLNLTISTTYRTPLGGNITVKPSSPTKGQEVTLTFTPDDEYSGATYRWYEEGTEIYDNTSNILVTSPKSGTHRYDLVVSTPDGNMGSATVSVSIPVVVTLK